MLGVELLIKASGQDEGRFWYDSGTKEKNIGNVGILFWKIQQLLIGQN